MSITRSWGLFTFEEQSQSWNLRVKVYRLESGLESRLLSRDPLRDKVVLSIGRLQRSDGRFDSGQGRNKRVSVDFSGSKTVLSSQQKLISLTKLV